MKIIVPKIKMQDLELKTSKTGKKYGTCWCGLGRDKLTGVSKGLISIMFWRTEGLQPDAKFIYNVVGDLQVAEYNNQKRFRLVVRDYQLTEQPTTKQQTNEPKQDLVSVDEEFDKWAEQQMEGGVK